MFRDIMMTQISEDFFQFMQQHIIIILHFLQDANDTFNLWLHTAEQMTNITTTETHKHTLLPASC